MGNVLYIDHGGKCNVERSLFTPQSFVLDQLLLLIHVLDGSWLYI